jgi:hypothetical protein
MLQVFYIDVAKVDRDVAHVAVVITYVSSVCSKCFIYFRRMLRVFYLDVANVDLDLYIYASVSSVFIRRLQVFSSGSYSVCNGYTRVFKFFLVFSSVSDECCKYFSCFGHMLQMFHLNIAKVDRMLHMLNGTHFAAAARAPLSEQTVLTCGQATRETFRQREPRVAMRNKKVRKETGCMETG